MKKVFLVLLALTFTISLSAQKKLKKQLDSVTTVEQAKVFLKAYKGAQNKLITFNEEKHKTRLSEEIMRMGKGATKTVKKDNQRTHYKVLEKNKITYYRVNYIFLDGTKMPIKDIEELRYNLILKLKQGIAFKDLAIKHSMDNTSQKGGDSGWFTYGDMLPEFEQQVMNDKYQIEDVFTVDVESNKWYYVVQKSHEKKSITEVKVLRIIEETR